jgi:peptide-methionine (S)-S-oxide reductase
MEKDFESLPGVKDVISGFTGGTAKNPTYRGDHSGHYEAVQITYDPDVVDYQGLLDYFWVNIDPFDAQGQFCDKGPSYRSAIFVANDEERTMAEASKQKVAQRFPDREIATKILPAQTFYPIRGDESYHQDYHKKSPVQYKLYRWRCGRDARLREIWGDDTVH